MIGVDGHWLDRGKRLGLSLVGHPHQQGDEDVVGEQRRAAVGEKGSVIPVSGSSRTTPAMMKKAWKPMIMVSPAATSLAKSDRPPGRSEPGPHHEQEPDHDHRDPRSPISSPMAAKIMSRREVGIGRRTVTEPEPGARRSPRCPSRTSPDELVAASFGSMGHGSSQTVDPYVDLGETCAARGARRRRGARPNTR